jgi:ABC-type lipoprotein release transport system permease subunit
MIYSSQSQNMKPYHDNFMTPALNKQMKRTANHQEVVTIRWINLSKSIHNMFYFLKKSLCIYLICISW